MNKKHKIRLRNRKILKFTKITYVAGLYIASIWVLETQFEISLFVKLACLFGIVKFLEKVK